MSVADIANDLVALCRAGQTDACGEKYWADDVVSVEAGGPPGMDPVSRGKAAVLAKGRWWADNHEVKAIEVEGPYMNGDQFTVHFKMAVIMKESGQSVDMDEHALYTVKGGKIVEERFFYGG